MNPSWKEVGAALTLDPFPDVWAADWQGSCTWAPSPEGLQPPSAGLLASLARQIGFSNDAITAIETGSGLLKRNAAAFRLFRHCHWLLFGRDGYSHDNIVKWPMLPRSIDPSADMFHALVFLAGVPAVRASHQRLGIPDTVTWETLRDLELWMHEHRKVHGQWGLSNLYWLWHHFQNRIFSLGRLQFCLDTFRFDLRGFRHLASGQRILLAPHRITARTDGQFDGATGVRDPSAFVTTGWETPGRIQAHPLSPDGRIQRTPITLEKRDWEPVLGMGDPAISVHIPATGPLDTASCAASWKRAIEFFPRHFPGLAPTTYFTVTWLFDNTFETLLPSDSNIVRFQKEFYLFPIPNANDRQLWERVFGKPYANLSEAPRHTSLQRTLLKHLAQGGHFHVGGGLRFADDTNWGTSPYRGTPLPTGT